jgi:hypothetical protein
MGLWIDGTFKISESVRCAHVSVLFAWNKKKKDSKHKKMHDLVKIQKVHLT